MSPTQASGAEPQATDIGQEGHVLDPIDRVSEILFGLFMVLTFTGTLSVATAGEEDVRTMLFTAIGCNIAWGFVDGVMFVLRNIVARGRLAELARTVREAAEPRDAHRLIARELGGVSAALDTDSLERIRAWVVQPAAVPAKRASATAADLRGGFGVFLLVFASTFPVVLPFVFFSDLQTAMRVSAAIAIAMMFYCGHAWGRYAGLPPWRSGLTMVLVGGVIETVIITLGG
ncbi:MAG: VIT1/CCC1 transporter family protein [Rubrivivax sp.]|nr:VIT1/CCC1 transporter family protein [Rubrivivax sp.]